MDLRLGFLSSHNGSNVKVMVDAIYGKKLKATPKVIISNNLDSQVLGFAKDSSIPRHCVNRENTKQIGETMLTFFRSYDVNLVILAGYMKKLDDRVLEEYPNRVLNMHPALLPKYGGKGMYGRRVHQAVINSDDVESGATVHLVNSKYDDGRILTQYKVPRYEKDSVDTLAERVLKIEHVLYVQTLMDIQNGFINLDL